MKIIDFNGSPTMADALDAVDGLRKDVEAGKVLAFVVAAVGVNDACIGYAGSSKPVSRLRMLGALSTTLHEYNAGGFG